MSHSHIQEAEEVAVEVGAAVSFPHIALVPSSFTAAVGVKELDEVEALATCARYGIAPFWRAGTRPDGISR